MPEQTLTASSPLDGFDKQYAEVALAEVSDRALVSIAVPLEGETALEEAVAKAYGASLPASGKSTMSEDGAVRFLGTQPDQFFALFDFEGNDAVGAIAGSLGQAGYYTDQSDNWAMLRLSGPLSRAALERICPLDLSPEIFAAGSVARTVMEHLGVIILCEEQDSFYLMSQSSSAKSFLHALETSIENVL